MVYPNFQPPNNYIICGNILFYDIHGEEGVFTTHRLFVQRSRVQPIITITLDLFDNRSCACGAATQVVVTNRPECR